MNDIKPILQTMVLSQIMWVLTNAFGGASKYMHPYFILKIYGFFSLFGNYYGGVISIVIVLTFLCLCGTCIVECAVYRFLVVFYQFKFKIKFIWCLLFHIFPLGTFIGMLVTYLVLNYGSMTSAEYIAYAKKHNVSYFHLNINYDTDCLIILNPDSSDYVSIAALFLLVMTFLVLLVCVLSILMYRKLSALSYISSIHRHRQQKKLTLMLLGQGSLPLIFVGILVLAFYVAAETATVAGSPSEVIWMLVMHAFVGYPLSSSLLTCTLTTPYFDFFKGIFKKMASFKFKEKVSVVVPINTRTT